MSIRLYDKIELVPAEAIRPNDWNPNIMSDRMYRTLLANIERVGFIEPIIVTRDGVIVNGEHRYRALKDLGVKRVPVVRLEVTSKDPMARLETLALNRIRGDYVSSKLRAVLVDLESLKVDLSLTGLDRKELRQFMGPQVDEDATPPLPAKPRTRVGDLITLGEHRLLCGSALDPKDMDRLMDGERSAMIHTDPPYNVNLGGGNALPSSRASKTRSRTLLENDNLSSEGWDDFCTRAIKQFKRANTGDVYVWTASGPAGLRLRGLLLEAGYHWGATIIWRKHHFVFSRANYFRQYEPCFYGWLEKSSFNDRVGVPGSERNQTDVWEFDRPAKSLEPPTMKPVALCERAIVNSSKEGGLVLDLFGGSGSTLMASEVTGRRCNTMEIDPGYCDVIVKRWEDLTGEKATRERGGAHA